MNINIVTEEVEKIVFVTIDRHHWTLSPNIFQLKEYV